MENPVVEDYSINWGVLILLIFFFIIIIAILVFFLVDFNTVTRNVILGGQCTLDDCVEGLVCDNSICKSPIGGHCDHISDCVSLTTACFNSMCVNTPLSDIGGAPPCKPGLINDHGICKVKIDGTCDKDSDCIGGTECKHKQCKKISFDYSSNSFNSPNSCNSYNSDNSNNCDSDDSDRCKSDNYSSSRYIYNSNRSKHNPSKNNSSSYKFHRSNSSALPIKSKSNDSQSLNLNFNSNKFSIDSNRIRVSSNSNDHRIQNNSNEINDNHGDQKSVGSNLLSQEQISSASVQLSSSSNKGQDKDESEYITKSDNISNIYQRLKSKKKYSINL